MKHSSHAALAGDLTAGGGVLPHGAPEWIGAREAERILGISRAACIKLAQTGKLPGKLIDEPGMGRRRWQLELAGVKRVRDAGTALRCPPRRYRIRAAWLRHFGSIPADYTVIARDGDSANTAPENLALVPSHQRLQLARQHRRRAHQTVLRQTRWTASMLAVVRRDFPTRATEEIAEELGCSALAVRVKAGRMQLRKSRAYLSQRAHSARSLPLGTERLMTGKNLGIVLVKVRERGTQSQQWRPKQHVVWEAAHGKAVPKGFRVIFRDGDKKNFESGNLELATRGEVTARAFAAFMSYPAPLQKAVRLNKQLQREIQSQSRGEEAGPRAGQVRPASRRQIRWTAEMVEVLERDHATKRSADIARALGVTPGALRQKARKLGLRVSPEEMVARAVAIAAVEKQKALSS